MAAGEHFSNNIDASFGVSRDKYTKHHKLRRIAGVAFAGILTAGIGAATYDGSPRQPAVTQNVSRDISKPVIPTTDHLTHASDDVLSYEEQNEAAEYLQDSEMVRQIGLRALSMGERYTISDANHDNPSTNRSVKRVVMHNFEEDRTKGITARSCENVTGGEERLRVKTEATLYRNGAGTLSIDVARVHSTPECVGSAREIESANVTMDIERGGIELFDMNTALYEIVDQPERAARVSSVSVSDNRNGRNKLKVSNVSAMGTSMSGTEFNVEKDGSKVTPRSLKEAREIAHRATNTVSSIARVS